MRTPIKLLIQRSSVSAPLYVREDKVHLRAGAPPHCGVGSTTRARHELFNITEVTGTADLALGYRIVHELLGAATFPFVPRPSRLPQIAARMSSVDPAAVLAAIVSTLTDVQAVKYATVASVAALVYDIFVTFDNEYEFIWNAKFTSGTLIYVSLRYGNLMQMLGVNTIFYVWGNAPVSYCRPAFYVVTWTTFVCCVPMITVLTFRAYATCDRDVRAKWFLIVVWAVCLASLFIENVWQTVQAKVGPPALPGMPCVFALQKQPLSGAIVQYAVTGFFDFVIFFVTLVRLWQLFLLGKTGLIRIILRDSFGYFCLLFATTMGQLIMLFGLPSQHGTLTPLLGNPARAFSVIVTSRMVLNLRNAAYAQVPTIDTLTMPPVGNSTQPDSSGDMRQNTRVHFSGGHNSLVFRRMTGTDHVEMEDMDQQERPRSRV